MSNAFSAHIIHVGIPTTLQYKIIYPRRKIKAHLILHIVVESLHSNKYTFRWHYEEVREIWHLRFPFLLFGCKSYSSEFNVVFCRKSLPCEYDTVRKPVLQTETVMYNFSIISLHSPVTNLLPSPLPY